MPQSRSDLSPSSVRTPPVVPSCPICPICGVPLTGRQTVCSAKCRITRSRQKRETQLQERNAKVRLLLQEALQLLKEATQ